LPADDPVSRLATTPAHSFVAAACAKTIRLMDPGSRRELYQPSYSNPDAPNPFCAIALAVENTNILAAHRAQGLISLWDLRSRARTINFKPFTNNVGALTLSPDGRFLAAADRREFYSTTLALWDLSASPQPPRLVWSLPVEDAILALAFGGADGQFLVAAAQPLADV